MIETLAELEEKREARCLIAETGPTAWRDLLRKDLGGAIASGRGQWSRAIMAVAWIHLGVSLACHSIQDPAVQRDPRLVLLWGLELIAVLAALHAIAGPRWFASSPAIGVVARLWGTFLILSFNLVMLNELTGWESRWYKPAWGTLSTFFFATMAWLFTPRFFIPAVQMSFTALLMVEFRNEDNLIYGLSWWVALMGIARAIRSRQRTAAAGEPA